MSDFTSCLLTAGHCWRSPFFDTVDFNVPPSDPNGDPVQPPTEDQYPVDLDSLQYVDGGLGNDWCFFGCFPNVDGQYPFERQGATFSLAAAPPPLEDPPQTIRVTGFGKDWEPERDQAQQTATGPYVGFEGTEVRCAVDGRESSSGSAMENLGDGLFIGIFAHSLCALLGYNSGTGVNNEGLQYALAHPEGICAPFRRGDANDDGTVDIADPAHILEYLFQGGQPPTCLETADGNDDGSLDIADPVSLLDWLFSGVSVPPPPGPYECGPDPGTSPGFLGCEAYTSCSS